MVAAREARFTFTADIDRFFRNLDTAQKKMDDLGNSGDRSAVKVTNSMDRSSAAIQTLGDRSAAAAIRFQTMTQGMLNLSTAAAQTYTSISNLARAENQIAQSTVSVARARDQLATLELKLSAERNKAAPNYDRIALIEQKIGTARADLAVKTDKLKLAEGNLLDIQILFVSNIANTMVSSLQTIKMLKDQHVVATIKQIYYERLANEAIYRSNGTIAVQQGLLVTGIPLLSATTRATIAQTYAQMGLTSAIRATMVALGPLGWALIGIGAAYTAYETNVLGVKDAINGFLGISNEEIGVLHEVQSSLDEAGNAHDRYTDKIMQNNKKIGESLTDMQKANLKYFHELYLNAGTVKEREIYRRQLEFYQKEYGIIPYDRTGGPSQASSQTGGGEDEEEEFDWWVQTAEGQLSTGDLPLNTFGVPNVHPNFNYRFVNNTLVGTGPSKRKFGSPVRRPKSKEEIIEEQRKLDREYWSKTPGVNITPSPYDSLIEEWDVTNFTLTQLMEKREKSTRPYITGRHITVRPITLSAEEMNNLNNAIEEERKKILTIEDQLLPYLKFPNALKKEEDEEERLGKIQYLSQDYWSLTPEQKDRWMEVQVRKDQERIKRGDLDYQEIQAMKKWADQVMLYDEGREGLRMRRDKYGHTGGDLYQWTDDKGEVHTTSKLSDIPILDNLGTPVNWQPTDPGNVAWVKNRELVPSNIGRGPVWGQPDFERILIRQSLDIAANIFQKQRIQDILSGKIPIEQLLKPDKLTLERMLWPTSSTGQDAMLNALGIKAAGSRSYIGTRRGISGLQLSYAIDDHTGKLVKTDRGAIMIKSYLNSINKLKLGGVPKGATEVSGVFNSKDITKKMFSVDLFDASGKFRKELVAEGGMFAPVTNTSLISTKSQPTVIIGKGGPTHWTNRLQAILNRRARGGSKNPFNAANIGKTWESNAAVRSNMLRGSAIQGLEELVLPYDYFGRLGNPQKRTGAISTYQLQSSALAALDDVFLLGQALGVGIPVPSYSYQPPVRMGQNYSISFAQTRQGQSIAFIEALREAQRRQQEIINSRLDRYATPLGLTRNVVQEQLLLGNDGVNDLDNRLRFFEKLEQMQTGTSNF